MKKGIVVDEIFWNVEFPRNHPVRTFRIKLALELIKDFGLVKDNEIIKPDDLGEEPLFCYHTSDYIEALRKEKPVPSKGLGDEENPVFSGLYRFLLQIVNSTLTAVDRASSGGVFFSIGGGMHHAKRDRASGFCYVNDVVIALNELKKKGKKVVYLDIDAHHCDAVQEYFYNSPEVLVISVHQEDVFPLTGNLHDLGEGEGYGYNVNIPLVRYSEDEDVFYIFKEVILPLIERFSPDVLFLQAGADGHKDDPLTHLYLTTGIYERIGELIHGLGIPSLVITGGGGYDMVNVARIWTLIWGAITGQKIPDRLPEWFLRISVIEGYDGPLLRDIPGWSGSKSQIKPEIRERVEFLKKKLFL